LALEVVAELEMQVEDQMDLIQYFQVAFQLAVVAVAPVMAVEP
jgi:hypothetical protein